MMTKAIPRCHLEVRRRSERGIWEFGNFEGGERGCIEVRANGRFFFNGALSRNNFWRIKVCFLFLRKLLSIARNE